MANRLLSFVVLAAGAAALVSWQRQSQRRMARESPKAKPVPVQTWEGEGGALPATGAQMGPDPVVTPAASDSMGAERPDSLH